ncbi:GMC family oxidoreductase N-terminal domain-containing protein [Rhizobium sp. 32-5/1]|uniref:GMC family oxidoreductase n=1 Tax=Rhizobium sp. 32-5/1 TaxID=3019602 RepID=UPI00240E7C82|nr:GMC family oxidoreductase N-terminal domain-containing protein [Rhizobium sp. 32-5/1]WEZ82994.1 GMC family oxidoreductase N-terminal domain-containing protein [Rhizobium sp. 32-5/1]
MCRAARCRAAPARSTPWSSSAAPATISTTGKSRQPRLGRRRRSAFFRKLETHAKGASDWHGGDGPIHVTPMRGMTHPVTDAFLDACRELQLPLNPDFNGAAIEGAGVYDINTRRGQRSHSSAEYLRPALKRPNLLIERNVHAERLIFAQDGRVTGVEARQNGALKTFSARREVIVATGAVGTPKLLQLSGLGDGAALSALGIQTHHHLPAVGANLQDHLCASFYYRANRPTLNGTFASLFGQGALGLQYLLTRKGPFAMSVNQAGGFFRGRPEEERPNIQLYFNPSPIAFPTTRRPGFCRSPIRDFSLPSIPAARRAAAMSPSPRTTRPMPP